MLSYGRPFPSGLCFQVQLDSAEMLVRHGNRDMTRFHVARGVDVSMDTLIRCVQTQKRQRCCHMPHPPFYVLGDTSVLGLRAV